MSDFPFKTFDGFPIKKQKCKECGEIYEYMLELGNDGFCCKCSPNKIKPKQFKIVIEGEKEK